MALFGLALVIAVVAIVGIGIAVTAGAISKNAKSKNQVAPGMLTPAPDNWFGSHEPEAKLHRRVRDAAAGLRATAASDPTMADTTASIDREAVRLDEQIVAASRMPESHKAEALETLEASVKQFEDMTAGLISRSSGLAATDVPSELDSLAERLDLVAEARAELDDQDDFPQSDPFPT